MASINLSTKIKLHQNKHLKAQIPKRQGELKRKWLQQHFGREKQIVGPQKAKD